MEVQVLLATPKGLSMEYYGKEKNVYQGIWIAFVVMFIAPVVSFFIVYNSMMRFNNCPEEVIIKISIGTAGIVGVAFCFICLFHDFAHDLFGAFINRIKDSIYYFPPFSKDGIKWYFYQFIHDGGPIMWVFLLIMAFYAFLAVFGVKSFVDWWQSVQAAK